MIYFATVHVGSACWIDIQRSFLDRHISEPFSVYACLEQVPSEYADRFDRVIPAAGEHAGKLNLLAAEIAADARPEDIVVFLDGDAFPVADAMTVVHRALEESTLVAVRRDENATDRQPHPSFCAVRCVIGSACTAIGHRDTAGRPSTGVWSPMSAGTSWLHWSDPGTPGLRCSEAIGSTSIRFGSGSTVGSSTTTAPGFGGRSAASTSPIFHA